MSLEIRVRPPILPNNLPDGHLASRLAEQLKLDFCSIARETQPVTLRVLPLGKSKFVFVENENELQINARGGNSTFIVWLALNGSERLQLGHEPVICSAGTGCIWPISTDVRIATTATHCALAIRIDRLLLELELSRLLGRPTRAPLVFRTCLKTDAAENILGHLLQFICGALHWEDSGLAESNILSAATETLLFDTLLLSQEHNYSEALNGLNVVVVPRHLRAVMRAVEANPKHTWCLADMAAEGGVSVRTVCKNFQRFRACTPKQFVQTVRLAHVRDELMTASKAISIARVARECGFRHPGRFAATYHRVYGEAPSDTVRRADCRERSPCRADAAPDPTN